MQVPLPWERLLWSDRSPLAPWRRYTLTDYRLIKQNGARSDELPVREVGDIHSRRSWLDRLLGTSTLVVHPRGVRRAPLVLTHVRHGTHLAGLLRLWSGDPAVSWDPESMGVALSWETEPAPPGYGGPLIGLCAIVIVAVAIAFSVHGRAASVSYPADDALYPGGVKKNHAAIVRFMETEVMPWAREALAPLVGGADAVTCETCHGREPEPRRWQMPAVVTLPEPDVAARGWEVYGGTMDAQMRNAIYGYIAQSDNQAKAAYMRKVVMPGMARLLHRPAYDFTRSYDFNRSHLAFGCYHCHRVK